MSPIWFSMMSYIARDIGLLEYVVVCISGTCGPSRGALRFFNVRNLPLLSVKVSFRITVSVKNRSTLKISRLIKSRAVLRRAFCPPTSSLSRIYVHHSSV